MFDGRQTTVSLSAAQTVFFWIWTGFNELAEMQIFRSQNQMTI